MLTHVEGLCLVKLINLIITGVEEPNINIIYFVNELKDNDSKR